MSKFKIGSLITDGNETVCVEDITFTETGECWLWANWAVGYCYCTEDEIDLVGEPNFLTEKRTLLGLETEYNLLYGQMLAIHSKLDELEYQIEKLKELEE